ncbi:MAG: ATP-binding cassette domain-containing protein [Vampirovibrionales bacterium]|nr:ATP-binding cassette domain-containing protein [Vampirovibrionales bacterium]
MAANAPPMRKNPQRADKVMIEVKDVYKSFNGRPVIQGVSLDVREHEVVAIIGTSGCGKSTLLKLIANLIEPDEGEIILRDENFSLVFQYSALFDSLNIFENVAFSLLEEIDEPQGKRKKYKQSEMAKIVSEKLEMVGLEGIERKYPNELSGGMKKRVSFARAIVGNPKIILYDEPTAGLDPIASTMTEDYILKLRNELNAASIVVTHQFSTIERTADRVCLLHEGKICWEGTPEELMQSDDPYARQFAHASLEGPMAPN